MSTIVWWRTSCARNPFSSRAAIWSFSAGWYVQPHKCTHTSLTSAESQYVPAVTVLVLEWPQCIPREKPISIQIIGELDCTCAPGCPNRNWDRQTKILMKCFVLPRESMGEKDMGGRGEKGWQHLSLFIYHCCVLMSRLWKSYDWARQTHMGGIQDILIFISFSATSASHLVAPVTSMVHIIWQPKKSSCNYSSPIKTRHAELRICVLVGNNKVILCSPKWASEGLEQIWVLLEEVCRPGDLKSWFRCFAAGGRGQFWS